MVLPSITTDTKFIVSFVSESVVVVACDPFTNPAFKLYPDVKSNSKQPAAPPINGPVSDCGSTHIRKVSVEVTSGKSFSVA